jgi:GTP-binding protein
MNIPNTFKVALVGRPNVGKSSLFNRLLGKRLSIVDAVPGITRDRLYGKYTHGEKSFDLIDTGGIFEGIENALDQSLLDQVEEAIQEADVLVHVMDVSLVHPMDRDIFLRLRRLKKPLLSVVNKVDNDTREQASHEFKSLGIENCLPVSALHNRGIAELEKMLLALTPETLNDSDARFKICIVGKPNVGKSSLVNKLLKKNRVIVHEKPGTTRDAIFIDFQHDKENYTLVDTAGLMRRNKAKEPIEVFSRLRAEEAIRKSNLVLLMLDADRGIEHQDLKIAQMVWDAGRCCILIVNKWDLTKSVRQEHYRKYMSQRMPWMDFAPLLFVSALQGKNLEKIMQSVQTLRANSFKRLPTGLVNQFFKQILTKSPPPFVGAAPLKIHYATQTDFDPPTFILFGNASEAPDSYMSFLRKQLREAFGFEGMPIRFFFKKKKSERG